LKNTQPMSRSTRRRLQTRAALIDAGHAVMAEKGLEGATINEITEAADVGFGSFYNHFESKEALFAAIIEAKVEPVCRRLDGLRQQSRDCAEWLAAGIRHSLRQVTEDSTWGWFIYRIGPWMLRHQAGLVGQMAQLIRFGIEKERFRTSDPDMAVTVATGGIIATISAMLYHDIGEDGPERVAKQCLVLLGISADEAEEISRRPLLPLEAIPAPETD